MRIVFISTYPYGTAPGQRFRYEQYIPILKEKGYVIEHYSFLSKKGWKILYSSGNTVGKVFSLLGSFIRRTGHLFKIMRADYVFMFREAALIGPPILEWIIAKVLRKKIIYDFDDAIWLPNYSDTNAKFHRLKMYKKVNRIMKWAHKITAGNEYLAQYARQFNENVIVIPTTVDTENMHNKLGNPDRTPVVIGWTGTHTTAKYISLLLPVFDELYKEHDFVFRIISNQDPEFKREYIDYVQWNEETEIEDLCTFNIGIMPLEDTIWSQGKCGFKGLQYMALHIPAVMSPVGVNKEIIEHGRNGFLCSTDEEWKSALKTLIEDKKLRNTLGEHGRQTVIDKYSVLSQTSTYLSLFNS